MGKHLQHDIGLNEGIWWCFTEGLVADFCEDEDRCSNNCVCNFDPDTRDMLQGLELLTEHTPAAFVMKLKDDVDD